MPKNDDKNDDICVLGFIRVSADQEHVFTPQAKRAETETKLGGLLGNYVLRLKRGHNQYQGSQFNVKLENRQNLFCENFRSVS